MIKKSEFIAQRIREVRRQQGISQAVLGKKCSLSTQYICQIETGKRSASLSALIKISDALGLSIGSLLYGIHTSENDVDLKISELLCDCDACEKRIIFETISSLKKSLKENRLSL